MIPFLHITTRIGERKHEDLLTEKGGRGTPYFAIMDEEGAVVAKPEWPFEPGGLRETVAAVRRWQELQAKGEAGDGSAAIDAALLACQLGQVPYDDLDVDGESMSESQLAFYTQLGVDSEISFAQASVQSGGRDKEKLVIIVNDIVGIYEAGQRPSTPALKYFFWQMLSQVAVNTGNVAMLEEAVTDTKKTPGLSEMSRGLEKKLVDVRAAGHEEGSEQK